MNLFVIGNGFDRAHELRTSYMDFRDYLENEDYNYLMLLEDMYNLSPDSRREVLEEYLWRNFEENLSSIKESEIIDAGVNIDLGLEGGDIGIEDTLNIYWQEQYGFIQRLNEFVMAWVSQIELSTNKITNRICQNTNDLFLTFNYTLVLEQIYGVGKNNILHIHGSSDEENDSLPVIGHGDYSKINEMKMLSRESGEKLWEKASCIFGALANYYERTCKDVQSFLRENRRFFTRLNDVEEIFIIGHSLGDVDMPYFEEIRKYVNEDVIWNVYYFNEVDENNFRNKIMSIGINENNIRVLHSDEFFI